MLHESRIDVAGWRIAIHSRYPILSDKLDRAYEAFLDQPAGTAPDVVVNVHLEAGLTAVPPGLPVVFDCAPTWCMFRDRDTRWMRRYSASHPDPFWVARISGDYREATVYCGDVFVAQGEGGTRLVNPVSYPFDQILLMCGLAGSGGILLHGAGLSASGLGMGFLGRSGAGKTTLSRILSGKYQAGLLSDDRVVVRRHPSGYRLYGTPWPGEAGIARNVSAPLTALFFLVHAEENRVVPVPPLASLERLLPTASVPWYDAGLASAAFDSCAQLVQDVPAFDLRFTPDRRAADVVEEFVQSWPGVAASPPSR